MTTPAPGRYCLAVCYCGECPHYKPLRRTSERDDLDARTDPTTTSSAWDDRAEPTWIDEL